MPPNRGAPRLCVACVGGSVDASPLPGLVPGVEAGLLASLSQALQVAFTGLLTGVDVVAPVLQGAGRATWVAMAQPVAGPGGLWVVVCGQEIFSPQ